MKISFDFKPVFVGTRWFVPPGFSGITILWWVFWAKSSIDPTRQPSETFKRHETIHSWQQRVLFALGVLACAATSLVLGVLGEVTPWWVWSFPATVPLILYGLAWLVELALPPYDRAYMDTMYEREAYANDLNPDYVPGVFSVWRYFLKDRK